MSGDTQNEILCFYRGRKRGRNQERERGGCRRVGHKREVVLRRYYGCEDREHGDCATPKWNLNADAGGVTSRNEKVHDYGGQFYVQYSQGTREKEKAKRKSGRERQKVRETESEKRQNKNKRKG